LGSSGHETIYRLISVDKAEGGSLYQQLRCQKKRKKHYVRGREHRGQIVDRRLTSERLNYIEGPTQIGHREGDTVIRVAHWQAIVTLVERKSGYALIAKVNNKTSELVSSAIYNKLEGIAPVVKTLTFDTGKEFAEHARIDQSLKSTAYFVEPFASWQRGSNENFNDFLYQYIPKKRPLSTLTDKELGMTESKLNNRPRKRLEFKTPYEVFMQPLNRVVPRV
jgi:IS30 family transposase